MTHFLVQEHSFWCCGSYKFTTIYMCFTNISTMLAGTVAVEGPGILKSQMSRMRITLSAYLGLGLTRIISSSSSSRLNILTLWLRLTTQPYSTVLQKKTHIVTYFASSQGHTDSDIHIVTQVTSEIYKMLWISGDIHIIIHNTPIVSVVTVTLQSFQLLPTPNVYYLWVISSWHASQCLGY